jgi:polyvinyl alcohol dehydrogenase (cytochrome)
VNSNSAAPIVIPGAVLAGTIDGHLRAYDPADGRITWTFNSAGQKYRTINGTPDQGGGAIDAGGAIVAEGMVFLMSGYVANMGGVPNNVLLALSVDGE